MNILTCFLGVAWYNGYINNVSYIPSVKNNHNVFTCINMDVYKSNFGLIKCDEKSIPSNDIQVNNDILQCLYFI